MAKHLHFMGIGGVGMSALALWYHHEGFRVSGCDAFDSARVKQLRAQGIPVALGHSPRHIDGVDVLVTTMAVGLEHPEIMEAQAQGITHLRRIRLLADIFAKRRGIGITGTHGKSTTTGMLAHILIHCGLEPSLLIGASLPAIGGNMHHAASDYVVAEVDESDPGFGDITSYLAVITNLESDHIAGAYQERRNYHATLDALESVTRRYIANSEQLLYCADWQRLAELCAQHPRAYSYGIHTTHRSRPLDYHIVDLALHATHSTFQLRSAQGEQSVHLNLLGEYNVLNATAALASADLLGVPLAEAAEALRSFHGIGRRFQERGQVAGARIIDDYAHHPTEIRATLRAAQHTGRRVRAVLQPHRWIRTAQQWREMADAACLADEVIVCDVYAASEAPISGVSVHDIVARIAKAGVPARYATLAEAEAYLAQSLTAQDMVITLGAGDVNQVALGLVARKHAIETTSEATHAKTSNQLNEATSTGRQHEQHTPSAPVLSQGAPQDYHD